MPFPGNSGPGTTCSSLLSRGDIRENVKPVLSELLDRVKAEAVNKEEFKA